MIDVENAWGKTTNQILMERGFTSDEVIVYDRIRDKIAKSEEFVYEPVILSRISGG